MLLALMNCEHLVCTIHVGPKELTSPTSLALLQSHTLNRQ